MKILMTGSTGMIGKLVLEHGLQSDQISRVNTLVRRASGAVHPKLNEFVLSDFSDYSGLDHAFRDTDIAFFCLGVYTGSVSDEELKRITVDYAVQFATTLAQHATGATFCLLSGAGADRSEKSKTSFARYKGMAENQIAALPLKSYFFRPGYIYPVEPRKEPNAGYALIRFLYPLIRLFGRKYSIPSTELARAMFEVALHGNEKQELENQDIVKIFKDLE